MLKQLLPGYQVFAAAFPQSSIPTICSPPSQSWRKPQLLTGNRLWNWSGCGCGRGCGGLSTRGRGWRRCRRRTTGGRRWGTYCLCLGLRLGLRGQHRCQLWLLNNFDPIWLSPRWLTCTRIIEIHLQFKNVTVKQLLIWRRSIYKWSSSSCFKNYLIRG